MQDPQTAPTWYEIRLSGSLSPGRAAWFENLDLTVERSPDGRAITVLSGPVADSAALFGALNRVRDLGLALISVNPVDMRTQQQQGS